MRIARDPIHPSSPRKTVTARFGIVLLAGACAPLRVRAPTTVRDCGHALPMDAGGGACDRQPSYAQASARAPARWPVGCVPSGTIADDRTLLRNTGLRGNEAGLTAARGVRIETLESGVRRLRWAVVFAIGDGPGRLSVGVDAVTGARLEDSLPGAMIPSPEFFPVAEERWGSTAAVELLPPTCPIVPSNCHSMSDEERAHLRLAGPSAPTELCGSIATGDYSYTTNGPCACIHRMVRGVAQAPLCTPCNQQSEQR